jgi:anti-sigma B factor antagonist
MYMQNIEAKMSVRKPDERASVIDIQGDVTAFAEETLMNAYNEATNEKTKAIILNFENLDYLNSGGIGLLVTLLIRAQRNNQRLLSFGLNEHYCQIFELTRLNEAIGIYSNEAQALSSLSS